MNNNVAKAAMALLKKFNDLDAQHEPFELSELQEESQRLLREAGSANDVREDVIEDTYRLLPEYGEKFHRITSFTSEDQAFVTIKDSDHNPIMDVVIEIRKDMPTVSIHESDIGRVFSAMFDRKGKRLMLLNGAHVSQDEPRSITTDVLDRNERVLSYDLIKPY